MATVSQDQLVRPVGETARWLALAWLAEADDALERLDDRKNGEALHDFRVALRRFRSSLRAYRPYLKGSAPKKASRAIRDLASATNAGRDAEVAIVWLTKQAEVLNSDERPGYDWLMHRLEAEKTRCYREAQQRIARDYREARGRIARRLSEHQDRAAENDSKTQRSFAQVTGILIGEHADDLKALLATVREPTDEDEAHNSRIAAKRLRYLVEPLRVSVSDVRPLVKQLKRLQDTLGDLHDVHVLTNEIAKSTQAVEVGSASFEASGDEAVGFLALNRLLRERQAILFEDLTTKWLGEESAFFFRALAAAACGLRHGKDNEMDVKY